MRDKQIITKQNSIVSTNPTTKLIWGTLGIYLCFFAASLLDEKIFKSHYQSFLNPEQTKLFKYPILLISMQYFTAYVISKLFNIGKQSTTHVPFTYSLKAAFLSVTGGITFNMGIIYTSLPLALLFRSCNLLSVILVGVCCSKVEIQSSNQKLGYQKLPIGIIVSIGIIMFYTGNSVVSNSFDNSILFGIGLLVICLIADGFQTDFKAQMKQKFKPSSLEMAENISKFGFLLSIIYMICSQQFFVIVEFLHEYPSLILDIISQSLMHASGLMFMYYIIANFQQHIAPLILTTRKVISAVISILVFKHQINHIQWVGLFLVFLGTVSQLIVPRILNKIKQMKKYKSYTMI